MVSWLTGNRSVGSTVCDSLSSRQLLASRAEQHDKHSCVNMEKDTHTNTSEKSGNSLWLNNTHLGRFFFSFSKPITSVLLFGFVFILQHQQQLTVLQINLKTCVVCECIHIYVIQLTGGAHTPNPFFSLHRTLHSVQCEKAETSMEQVSCSQRPPACESVCVIVTL